MPGRDGKTSFFFFSFFLGATSGLGLGIGGLGGSFGAVIMALWPSLKTRTRSVPALIARLSELHSYEVPEAIVLPIVAGSRPYLAWLMGETADPSTRARPRQPRKKKK